MTAGDRPGDGSFAGARAENPDRPPRASFPPPVRRVHELMNPDVVCARPGMAVREVARLLAERRVSGAPVVDDHGHILGVVSQGDLGRLLAERTEAGRGGSFFSNVDAYRDLGRIPFDASRTPVEQIMQSKVYTVARDVGVALAANIMRERRVHRLLVTERGVLVGVISALDLLVVVEEQITAPAR